MFCLNFSIGRSSSYMLSCLCDQNCIDIAFLPICDTQWGICKPSPLRLGLMTLISCKDERGEHSSIFCTRVLLVAHSPFWQFIFKPFLGRFSVSRSERGQHRLTHHFAPCSIGKYFISSSQFFLNHQRDRFIWFIWIRYILNYNWKGGTWFESIEANVCIRILVEPTTDALLAVFSSIFFLFLWWEVAFSWSWMSCWSTIRLLLASQDSI